MDLFHVPIKLVSIPIEQRIESAINVITDLFVARMPLVCAFSSGKDSSILLMLTLWAAERAVSLGITPVLWILHADTGVESPVIVTHARTELSLAKAYASSRGIQVEIGIAKPSMSSSWLLRIVGGRALPSFPDNSNDCSVDWKVTPMSGLRKKLAARFSEANMEPCTLVGTRFGESQARELRMRLRGDSATTPVPNKQGELVLSPLAHWSDEDVWEALALVKGGALTTYTDTEQLFAVYRDAGPSSCAVINDSILEGVASSSRGGCGSRMGCWACLKVKTDASMENFLKKEEYSYMQGLNDLRNFMAATQYDFSRRQWIGRTIKHRYVAVRPDAYSPAMMRELFRYVLTLQVRENEEAVRLGIEPRFQIITEAGIVRVDALWSLNGFQLPFAAIEDYVDVFLKGVRYDIPKIEDFPKIDMPAPRFLEVGESWDDDVLYESTWNGLRDSVGEALWSWSNCMTTRQLKDGRTVLNVNTDDCFTIDEESAMLTLHFDAERCVELRNTFHRIGGYTQGYKWWMARGTIALAKGQVGRHDYTLRRTAYKERWGLCGQIDDLSEIMEASIPWYEVPEEVQTALINKSTLAELKAKRQFTIDSRKQQQLFA